MRFAKWTVVVLTVLILGTFTAQSVFAQTSSITGKIVDTDGRNVPYVNVTATNTATGEDKVAITGDAGTYKVDGLAPGTYKMSLSVQGFVMPEIPNVTLGATDTKQLDFKLTMTFTERMVRKTWPFFNWSEESWLGNIIRNHQYPFAVIEVVHLFGLTLLLGGIFLMSLRLFGFIMKDMPLSQVARQLGWISFAGLVVMAVTGASLFASEALKCYNNNMYWYKMAFFFPATIFHFTMYRKVTRSDSSKAFIRGLTGFLALFLWFGVAVFGRAIGYF
jgi:carboxypeptidase family protein/uncharacterized protein DUF6644